MEALWKHKVRNTLPRKLVEDFQQRTLQIDFIELKLLQNKKDSPISYRGTGYIRQTEDDSLTFKLYSVQTENIDLAAHFNAHGRVKSGKLYDTTDYYTLTGIAIDGSTWTAENILPACDWLGQNPNPVVKGTLATCVRGQRVAGGKGLRMHYFDKADLPTLVDQVKFQAAGCEFHIQKSGDAFTVTAKAATALPNHLFIRIEETLRFILARSVSCRILMEADQLHLFSRRQDPHATRLSPPIARGGPAFHDYSWRLFESFLAYVLRETAQPYWNPCSNHLHNACEASANALDAWAIGLGVAVEGLANLLPKELDDATKKTLEALQAFINTHVSLSSEHKEHAPRIKSMLNGLTQIRAIDRMKALAESGGTEPALVAAWQKLRNRGVHPTKRGGADIASLDFQRLIDEVHQVTVLMYHIVFALIGYKGPYTDYAVHGFPQRDYPPGLEAPSPETSPGATPRPVPAKTAKPGSREKPHKKPAVPKRAPKMAKKKAAKRIPRKAKTVRRSRS